MRDRALTRPGPKYLHAQRSRSEGPTLIVGSAPTQGGIHDNGSEPMTAAVALILLSSVAISGILWTAWDIRTDLRRRRPE